MMLGKALPNYRHKKEEVYVRRRGVLLNTRAVEKQSCDTPIDRHRNWNEEVMRVVEQLQTLIVPALNPTVSPTIVKFIYI